MKASCTGFVFPSDEEIVAAYATKQLHKVLRESGIPVPEPRRQVNTRALQNTVKHSLAHNRTINKDRDKDTEPRERPKVDAPLPKKHSKDKKEKKKKGKKSKSKKEKKDKKDKKEKKEKKSKRKKAKERADSSCSDSEHGPAKKQRTLGTNPKPWESNRMYSERIVHVCDDSSSSSSSVSVDSEPKHVDPKWDQTGFTVIDPLGEHSTLRRGRDDDDLNLDYSKPADSDDRWQHSLFDPEAEQAAFLARKEAARQRRMNPQSYNTAKFDYAPSKSKQEKQKGLTLQEKMEKMTPEQLQAARLADFAAIRKKYDSKADTADTTVTTKKSSTATTTMCCVETG
eukprot:TRINITY_DN67304_c1_g1_i1.p1 TRINITY_DN67304_c1_g1~~TRINITY_DN67304_c1_g1_i1.p1  ORF type:complete len:341 (-),score=58.59 TRINITY_DN67304_c1_g1_i1:78-1100(-)